MERLLAIAYVVIVIGTAASFLDFMFWTVVALVLWFAIDTYKAQRADLAVQDAKHLEMETINGQEGKV